MLTPDQMPMPFAAQALLWAATSNYLNPINRGQSNRQRILGKPLRALARLIYQFATGFFLAIPGFLYHLTMAVNTKRISFSSNDNNVRLLNKTLAWENFKCALHDIEGFIGIRTPFFANPISSISHYLSSTLVKSTSINPLPIVLETIKNQERHQKDAANMQQGLYRFDDLVHRALELREEDGAYPSLDDRRVHILCFNTSVRGIYGKYE